MQAIVDTKYFKNTQIISPGIVGSVGDVLGSVRMKQSAPDMPMLYDSDYYGKNEERVGSNVQDGFSYSYTSGGGPARLLDFNLNRPSMKINHGWRYQDLRAPDKSLGERMGSTGRFDWYNRVANIYEAKRTGELFLPLPGGYQPGDGVPRGGQVPRIVATDVPMAPNADAKQIAEVDGNEIVGYQCTDKNGKVLFTPRDQPLRKPQGTQGTQIAQSPATQSVVIPGAYPPSGTASFYNFGERGSVRA